MMMIIMPKTRAGDLPSGIEDKSLSRQALVTGIRQLPVDVFHHHHRGVDHHADGDGQAAQGHQIGSETELIHHEERHERRHDERRRHDQGAPSIAQEHEQHDHHQ